MQGFDAGADDYVAKPFHPEVLARIRACAPLGRTPRRVPVRLGAPRLAHRPGASTATRSSSIARYRPLAYLITTPVAWCQPELVEHLYDQTSTDEHDQVFVGRIRKKLGVDVIQTVRGSAICSPPS